MRQSCSKLFYWQLAFLLGRPTSSWPDAARATLYNDLAIGLFVLDVFLVMVGWPASSPDESFAESYKAAGGELSDTRQPALRKIDCWENRYGFG